MFLAKMAMVSMLVRAMAKRRTQEATVKLGSLIDLSQRKIQLMFIMKLREMVMVRDGEEMTGNKYNLKISYLE